MQKKKDIDCGMRKIGKMSTTEGRRERIQTILEFMFESKRSLTPNEIAGKTGVLKQISKERFYIYLADLEWCGMINRHGNLYSVNFGSPIKNERERRSKKERNKK